MRFSSKLIVIGFIVFLTGFVGIKAVNMFSDIADNNQNRIDSAFLMLNK
ncbi:hypothetical protein KAU11_06390 [Candidatus Babeliales bacterium]|nr:hypothetical protein [Candidatus Babeliales bacterium]